jgi:hypothetical protein
MTTRTAACAALLALTAALTACSSSGSTKADPAACKAALTKDFKAAAAAGDKATPADRPAACDGIDDKTAQKLATEVLNEQVDDTLKGLSTATP